MMSAGSSMQPTQDARNRISPICAQSRKQVMNDPAQVEPCKHGCRLPSLVEQSCSQSSRAPPCCSSASRSAQTPSRPRRPAPLPQTPGCAPGPSAACHSDTEAASTCNRYTAFTHHHHVPACEQGALMIQERALRGAVLDEMLGGAGRGGVRLGGGVLCALLLVAVGHGLRGLCLAGQEQLQAQPPALPA